jgi:5-methylcytosine-specific restriction enzyme A
MATYLLAWNPRRWTWDDLSDMASQVRDGHVVKTRWSCGSSKKIAKGDRVFLIRLGVEPRGIFGSGRVVEGSFPGHHWDRERAASGVFTNFVEIRFDVLLDPEIDKILPRTLLNEPPFSQMHWDTQMSGVRIPDGVAKNLEATWVKITRSVSFAFPEELETGTFYEGAAQTVLVNRYERSPEARSYCIAHYGTECFICGFDFGRAYGEVGRGFIHVHHLRQLADIGEEYQVDPIRDLRPVCPNCHALIHTRRPPYSIEEVQAFVNVARSQDKTSL